MNTQYMRKVSQPGRIYSRDGYQVQYAHQPVQQQPQQIQNPTSRKVESKAAKQVGANYLPSIINEAYHNVLEQVVTAMCYASGFDELEEGALETLLLIFHAKIKRIAEQSRLACEIAGRTLVTPGDAWFGMINAGIPVLELPRFLENEINNGTLTIHAPEILAPENKVQTLHVGVPRPHPQNVFDWMPPLPDNHTYIRTDITNEPDMSYEKTREAMAQKYRSGVTSLVNFMIRTYPSICMFDSFRNVINEQVHQMVEKESVEKRLEEAFISFRDLLGTNEIDTVTNSAKLLYEKNLIRKSELESGVELGCLCSDGTIMDMNGKIVKVTENTIIDLEEKDKIGSTKTRVHCLEAGAESLRFHWNMDEMVDEMIEMDSCAMDISNRNRADLDEMDILKNKFMFEYIPEWCHILEPSFEHRAYLQPDANDGKVEEEIKKEIKTENEEKPHVEESEEENAPDNPYFRPPFVLSDE